jgi:hypothetical protein
MVARCTNCLFFRRKPYRKSVSYPAALVSGDIGLVPNSTNVSVEAYVTQVTVSECPSTAGKNGF